MKSTNQRWRGNIECTCPSCGYTEENEVTIPPELKVKNLQFKCPLCGLKQKIILTRQDLKERGRELLSDEGEVLDDVGPNYLSE